MAHKRNYEEIEKRFRLIADHTYSWEYWTGPDSTLLYVSPSCERHTGYTRQDFMENENLFVEILHPEDADDVLQHVQYDTRAPAVESFTFRIIDRSGRTRWISHACRPVYDENGTFLGRRASNWDITDQKQAERERDKSTRQFKDASVFLHAVLDAIPDVIGVQDLQHRILRYNRAGYELLNKTASEVRGKKCFELIGNDEPCDICATSEVYESKKPAQREKYVKELNKWLDVRAYPVFDEEGNLTRIIEHLRDITEIKQHEEEKRRMEQQLLQAQKLEAIGTLAGGIAHDFNNLLMGVQGRASLMALELNPDHPCREHVEAIMECSRSATELTSQLLGVARGGKYEAKPMRINDVVVASSTLFGRTKKEIRIHTKLHDPSPVVVADRRQVEQALLNLFINAWQAMPAGGELYLETSITQLDEGKCRPFSIKPGRFATLSVTDTGVGMEEDVRKRIFDPFFTTKKMGRGAGLGLSSVYGIVKNHSGAITVHSEIGQGTTFNIYLPFSGQKAEKEPSTNTEMMKGTETILLVDDESMVLDVSAEMLEKLGYEVVTAASGKEAVQAFVENVDRIDLIILDMIMPGMDGGKTFDQLRNIRSSIPVLLSSGYSLNGQANTILQRGCNGFVQKPFSINQLSQKIRDVLDEKGDLK
jgi:PAS domain S-box-containing protein